MPLLQLREIMLSYGAVPLLDHIDFQVEAGRADMSAGPQRRG